MGGAQHLHHCGARTAMLPVPAVSVPQMVVRTALSNLASQGCAVCQEHLPDNCNCRSTATALNC